jgi:hypothetical protein
LLLLLSTAESKRNTPAERALLVPVDQLDRRDALLLLGGLHSVVDPGADGHAGSGGGSWTTIRRRSARISPVALHTTLHRNPAASSSGPTWLSRPTRLATVVISGWGTGSCTPTWLVTPSAFPPLSANTAGAPRTFTAASGSQ